MATEYHILTVSLDGKRSVTAPKLYQYDYGQLLRLKGVDLPDAYTVHFGHDIYGRSKAQVGTPDGVFIPDEYLLTASNIHAWFFLHDAETDGETEYHITIPVERRAKACGEALTPVEQSYGDQLIGALNSGVQRAEGILEEVNNQAEVVTDKAREANQSALDAKEHADRAEELTQGFEQTVQTATTAINNKANEVSENLVSYAQTTVIPTIRVAGTTQAERIQAAGDQEVRELGQARLVQVNAINQAGTQQIEAINAAAEPVTQAAEEASDAARRANASASSASESARIAKEAQRAIEEGTVKIDVDSNLSLYSKNPVQNKTITQALNQKVDAVSGKGLSTNDFTDSLKSKLAAIESGATKTVIDSELSDTSTNPLQNKAIKSALDQKVDAEVGKGLSSNDFTDALSYKLENIETRATRTVVDSLLNPSSTNPVQNKVIYNRLSSFGVSLAINPDDRLIYLINSQGSFIGSGIGISADGDIIYNYTVDDALSDISENPVQNKVIYEALQNVAGSIYPRLVELGYEGSEEELYQDIYYILTDYDQMRNYYDSYIENTTLYLFRGDVVNTTIFM